MNKPLFDWDDGNLPKCTARVPQKEIEALLTDARTKIGRDPSDSEERFRATGHNHAKRPIFVVFTIRYIEGVRRIRPVSARYAHQKEAQKWLKN
jgi:uncharacterized protein